MTVNMGAEAVFFLLSLCFGLLAGLLYDLLRISRIALGVTYEGLPTAHLLTFPFPLIGAFVKRKKRALGRISEGVLVFLCDLVWGLALGGLYSVFLYAAHDGVFRFYSLVGAILGFWVYYICLGRPTLFCVSYLLLGLRLLFRYLLFFLLYPLRLLWRNASRSLPPFSPTERAPSPSLLGLLPHALFLLYMRLSLRRRRIHRRRVLSSYRHTGKNKTSEPKKGMK